MKNKFNIGDKVLCDSFPLCLVKIIDIKVDCAYPGYLLSGDFVTYSEDKLFEPTKANLISQYMREVKKRLSPRFSYHKFLNNEIKVRINPALYSLGDIVFIKDCLRDSCFYLHIGIIKDVTFVSYGSVLYGIEELQNSHFCGENTYEEEKLEFIGSRILTHDSGVIKKIKLITAHLSAKYDKAIREMLDDE